ncbi:MAG: Putative Nuclease sbcCD subunit C [Clostridiales bacterium 38_11]|nr:MAG: Putative Nuclease sbcCD subunit C [Clostridiales bacterium 38_11]
MKPINLKIKGLNSFEEEQEIDFIALTRGGFFGIFGPTGSGKSTILDGIMLALYGDVPRNSADFINVNGDKAHVSFEFQISGNENKRYLVQRDFKRDKNSLKPRTDKCKIMDITSNHVVILEESVKGVTEKCTEIIGLSKDDFTRTVVLPQGKFSDFLKMEGKNRNDMLERLFNLQEYGDNLRQKLKARLYRENSIKNSLEGEIKGLGEVSEDIIEAKEREYNTKRTVLATEQEELKLIIHQFEESKEINKMQEEYEKYLNENKNLLSNKEMFKQKSIKLEQHKNANSMANLIKDFEKIRNEKVDINKRLERITDRRQAIKEEKTKSQKELELAKDQYENILPGLRIKEQKVIEALEEEKELIETEKLSKPLKSRVLELEGFLKDADETKQSRVHKVQIIEKELEKLIIESGALKVDTVVQEKVRTGEKLTEDIMALNDSISKIQKKLLELSAQQEEYSGQRKEIDYEKYKSEESLKNLTAHLNELKENCPGTPENLSDIQDNLYELKTKWIKHEELEEAIKKNKHNIQQLNHNKTSMEQIFQDLTRQLEQINAEINESKNEAVVYELRMILSEGEPCPVCGSKEHYPSQVKSIDLKNREKLEMEKSDKTQKLKKTEKDINEIIVKLSIENEQEIKFASELKNLGKDYLLKNPESEQEKFDKLKQLINLFEEESNQLTLDISKTTNTITKQIGRLETIDASLSGIASQLKDYNEELKAFEKKVSEKQMKIESLKAETGIIDFLKESQAIRKKDEQRERLEAEINILSDDEKKIKKELEASDSDIKRDTNELIELKADYKNKLQLIEKLTNSIVKKAGTIENLGHLRDETTQKIIFIEQNYKTRSDKNSKCIEDFESVSNEFYKVSQSSDDIEKRFISADKTLIEKLNENRLASIEEAKILLTDKANIKKLEQEIKDYDDAVSRIKGVLESIEEKLAGRQITKEKWQEIQNQKMDKENLLNLLKKEYALLEQEINYAKDKLSNIKGLMVQIKKIDERLGILEDLEKLFKGKEFVKFIATERLKYISREASVRLLNISGGVYGLETDEEGRFLIKDNKNGGILRESSTLSGGETFLTSLALALALSAEIQLKGTAPLELFFLDEGFGTLDDNLLDVVMTSLEKIHHDKLKVGIISHVESVKNRVPVKLIVTGAVTGEGGSKVRIELN